MPRPKLTINGLPPSDLAYAVHRLIADGKTTAAEVLRLAGERVERIKIVEAELLALTGRGRTRVRNLRATAKKAPAPKPTKPARRKLKMTPKRRAQLKAQGTYIGLLRALPPKDKAKMKALAKEEGMAAAVEVIRKGGR